MANRSRGPAPKFKPPATQEQLEQLASSFSQVVGSLASRLSVTEFAVSELIRDVYAGPEHGEEPCEDCEKDDAVPGDADGSEEARERHERMATGVLHDDLVLQEEDDAVWAAAEAQRLGREAAEANWEGEGGR